MRNFFPSSSPAIFDKMFGKGARQIQADPSTNLVGCCCNCKSVACKGCISGHVISPDAGCCHGRNNGLIFEYERPNYEPRGAQCSDDCPNTAICCNAAKQEASNVRFYYNYIGQYFKIDFSAKKIRPKLCSYCDPTSSDPNRFDDGFPAGNETCVDAVYNSQSDARMDPYPGPNFQGFADYPCSGNGLGGPNNEPVNYYRGCQCMGDQWDFPGPAPFPLNRDPVNTRKRLSKYRKRQMERDPYYRWLLDIMCYDNGKVVASPYYEYTIEGPDFSPQKRTRINGGTLYDHLVAVVHCEHWYEIARCDENPEHGDGNLLGQWIVDADGNPVGANTSLLAPRFWIYACSGAPIFDFDLERAYEAKDPTNANIPLLTEDEKNRIIRNLANEETPKQEIMDKLASIGIFDVGDWRPEALSEIRVLKGLTYTREAYGGNFSGPPDEGACCIAARTDTLPDGSTIEVPASCIQSTEDDCRVIHRGEFYSQSNCTSDLCSNCSGFKPGTGQEKYLGPVRKRLWIPSEYGGINWNGIPGPARLDPKKARKNTRGSLLVSPSIARLEIDIDDDNTLTNLQLPDDLIIDPWNGSYPPEPIGSEEPSDEWKDFVTWRESQWLYMHAKPGGWDYVCPAFGAVESISELEEIRIPNIPRRSSGSFGNAFGGCLDGVFGFPRKNYLIQGGCFPIDCSGNGSSPNGSPEVQCSDPCNTQGSIGLECIPVPYCPWHPEHGGGSPPCVGVAYSSNCDGMRWLKYQHTFVPGDPGYYTCDGLGLVNSYLYRVNLDVGNFSEFCPHRCRPLEIPERIANAVPKIFSNKSAHASLCQKHLAANFRPDLFPYEGTICPGLFCKEDPIPTLQPGGFFLNSIGGEGGGACCGESTNGPAINNPLPSNSNHDASNKVDCPLYPGPPCYTPECDFYDFRFTGQYLDWDPEGCCWTCTENIPGAPSQPVQYKGFISYTACQRENEQVLGSGVEWDGRGFLYVPDQISNASLCAGITVGRCACGSDGNWSFGAIRCSPQGPITGNDDD